jgi:probable phosphoglycerate mutase
MRIVFVRHGDPDYANDRLTSLGRRQAYAAAVRLREERIEKIYSSPMGRATETAGIAADVLGLEEPEILDFMHELQWGSADGSPLFAGGHPWAIADEMVRTGWDLADPGWTEHPFFRNNKAAADIARVDRGIDEWLASLGYRREGSYYRNTGGSENLRTVALFSHGGSSAAAIGRILGLPFPYVCAVIRISFTGITVIRLDGRPGSISPPSLELSDEGRHILGVR